MRIKIISSHELNENILYYSYMLDKLKLCSIFQDPRWGLILKNAYGFEPYLLLVYDSRDIILASMLLIYDKKNNRVLVDDGPCTGDINPDIVDLIIKTYIKFAKLYLKAFRIEFRKFPYVESNYNNFITFSYRGIKNINRSLDDIWKSFKKRTNIRKNVRKAHKFGVRIMEAKTSFDYNIHIKLQYLSKIYGGLSLKDPFIRNYDKIILFIKEILQDNHKLYLAKIDDRIIASALWLFDNKRRYAYYFDVGLDRRFKNYFAPDALMWQSIVDLKKIGIKIIDLMGINLYSESSRFKKRYADILVPNKGFIIQKNIFYLKYLLNNTYIITSSYDLLRNMIRRKKIGD